MAWLPQHLIYGKPYILDVAVVSGLSVAQARDDHFHKPPDYLVIEPEDTKARTKNLQQTNTSGHKFQGTVEQFKRAKKVVEGWGPKGRKYEPTRDYQLLLRELISRFPYRLDTNYAKMDRIVHPGIEEFKSRVHGAKVNGMAVREWIQLLLSEDDARIKAALKQHLSIKENDAGKLLS